MLLNAHNTVTRNTAHRTRLSSKCKKASALCHALCVLVVVLFVIAYVILCDVLLSLFFPLFTIYISHLLFLFPSLFFFIDTELIYIYTLPLHYSLFFFLNDTAPPEISPFPLPDPLPI